MNAAAVCLLAFAASFIALGLKWIRFDGPESHFIWMAAYFALCAALTMGTGLCLATARTSRSSPDQLA